jgi:murein DD-endopeptidase MepM/ murein hydrolase activator NlpD
MTRVRRTGGRLIPAFAACFAAGVVTGWWLRGGPPSPAERVASDVEESSGSTSAVPTDAPAVQPTRVTATSAAIATNRGAAENAGNAESAIVTLHSRNLRVPIDGADVERLKGMFAEARDAGGHAHEAVDMLAPRNTPIHAVEDGTIAKLFSSKAGGLTIYQFDPTQRFCYYYAHLERYAAGLRDGQRVSRGNVIGYVGTSGNAPANTPHLHFAVFVLGPERQWWKGRPIDPYLVLTR